MMVMMMQMMISIITVPIVLVFTILRKCAALVLSSGSFKVGPQYCGSTGRRALEQEMTCCPQTRAGTPKQDLSTLFRPGSHFQRRPGHAGDLYLAEARHTCNGMQSEAPRAIVEGLAQCRRTNSVSLRIYSMLQSRPGHDIFRLSLFSEPVNKREQS